MLIAVEDKPKMKLLKCPPMSNGKTLKKLANISDEL